MLVRRARIGDVEAMALVIAAIAEEGLIGTEPPVDLEARARRLQEMIEAESPTACWVLEDAGRVVGNADFILPASYTSGWGSCPRRAHGETIHRGDSPGFERVHCG